MEEQGVGPWLAEDTVWLIRQHEERGLDKDGIMALRKCMELCRAAAKKRG